MPTAPALTLVEFAPAKVNLTLRLLGRRDDGYHELESLVVFATVGDRLNLIPNPELTLAVRGPAAEACGPVEQNLVLRAAGALAKRIPGLKLGHFGLTKNLPIAAGLGGGSADAAAALRLLARFNDLPLKDPRLLEAAAATGGDVPVCLASCTRVMRGKGDVLSPPLHFPPLPAVLANPGVSLPTRDVFARFDRVAETFLSETSASLRLEDELQCLMPIHARPERRMDRLLPTLEAGTNDLELPAIQLQPVIADLLASLRALPGCRLARMSGSGATCFALFDSARASQRAARALKREHPEWWVRATMLG